MLCHLESGAHLARDQDTLLYAVPKRGKQGLHCVAVRVVDDAEKGPGSYKYDLQYDDGDEEQPAVEQARLTRDEICAEVWDLFSRLWCWFEERGVHAVWGVPEDLLQVMRKWPQLADYIEADEQRSLKLREITGATLDRTVVSSRRLYQLVAFLVPSRERFQSSDYVYMCA